MVFKSGSSCLSSNYKQRGQLALDLDIRTKTMIGSGLLNPPSPNTSSILNPMEAATRIAWLWRVDRAIGTTESAPITYWLLVKCSKRHRI